MTSRRKNQGTGNEKRAMALMPCIVYISGHIVIVISKRRRVTLQAKSYHHHKHKKNEPGSNMNRLDQSPTTIIKDSEARATDSPQAWEEALHSTQYILFGRVTKKKRV